MKKQEMTLNAMYYADRRADWMKFKPSNECAVTLMDTRSIWYQEHSWRMAMPTKQVITCEAGTFEDFSTIRQGGTGYLVRNARGNLEVVSRSALRGDYTEVFTRMTDMETNRVAAFLNVKKTHKQLDAAFADVQKRLAALGFTVSIQYQREAGLHKYDADEYVASSIQMNLTDACNLVNILELYVAPKEG